MTAAPPAPSPSSAALLRLAGQVQTLSELTESLAYRLLEAEERLAALQVDAAGAGLGGDHADTELRLDDTEERLGRLEDLIGGLQTPDAAGEAIFPEEAEQPFMDEIAAGADPFNADQPEFELHALDASDPADQGDDRDFDAEPERLSA